MKPIRFLSLFTISLVVTTFPTINHATDWKELGPAPLGRGNSSGRLSTIAPSPSDPDKFYVGGASGGVWKLEGTTWTSLTDDMPSQVIGAIAVDPTDDDIVYAGTGEPNYAPHSYYGIGLYKSTDGGRSWALHGEKEFAGLTFSRIVVSKDDPQTLFAAISRAGGFPHLRAAKNHPNASGPAGMFRSKDGGETWEQLSGGLPSVVATDIVMHPTDSKVLTAAIADPFGSSKNGIYQSTDSGDSWTKLGGGLPDSDKIGRSNLAIAPSDGNRIYVIISGVATTPRDAETLGVWRSDDGGKQWSRHNPGKLASGFGWYYISAGVDPKDPDVAYFGGMNLVRTNNGGSNFSNVTPPHVDQHAVVFDANGNLIAGHDGGIARSTNKGSSWKALNNGLATVQFYPGISISPDDENWVLAGAQDNGTNLRNKDDPAGWRQVNGADGGYTALHPEVPRTILIQMQHAGAVLRSTNGGSSFSNSSSGINSNDRDAFMCPMIFDPQDPKTAYYATHRIYKSTNSGASWSSISGDLSSGDGAVRALAIAPSNSKVMYALTNDGQLLVSEDGGSQWETHLTDLPGNTLISRQLVVDSKDEDIAYLAVEAFGVDQVRKTIDRGKTWTAIDSNLPDIPADTISIHHVEDRNFLFLGTDSGLYVSCNDGDKWQLADGIPRVMINDITVDEKYQRVVINTFGRGVWQMPIPKLDDSICDPPDDDDTSTEDDDDDDDDDDEITDSDSSEESSADTSSDNDNDDDDDSDETPESSQDGDDDDDESTVNTNSDEAEDEGSSIPSMDDKGEDTGDKSASSEQESSSSDTHDSTDNNSNGCACTNASKPQPMAGLLPLTVLMLLSRSKRGRHHSQD